jgi:TldD protein
MPPDPAVNFPRTGRRCFRIGHGRLAGPLKDVARQATTTDFRGSMEALGGPRTYVLGGAFNCGKAGPGQVAAVGHGCPAALFRGVSVLNTTQEAGR